MEKKLKMKPSQKQKRLPKKKKAPSLPLITPKAAVAEAVGESSEISLKPVLRGKIHLVGFVVAIISSVTLLLTKEGISSYFPYVIYCLSLVFLFGVSGLYHSITWDQNTRKWLRRLDHAGILIFISGTGTPIFASLLNPVYINRFLGIYWLITLLGVLKIVFYSRKSKLSSVLFYIFFGALPFAVLPFSESSLSGENLAILLFGGLIYCIGAVFYALKRPNLIKGIFGYHELFHSCVLLAAGMHFYVITVL